MHAKPDPAMDADSRVVGTNVGNRNRNRDAALGLFDGGCREFHIRRKGFVARHVRIGVRAQESDRRRQVSNQKAQHDND
jgi:hypothetical protein